MLLKWYNQNCGHVPYLLKCDDDVFLNTKNLYDLVSKTTVEDVLVGYLFCGTKPTRNAKSKWYVPESRYSEDTFPPRLNGPGYLMSASVAQKLFRASRKVPVFIWEDVYITGMVARAAGITPDDHNGFNHVVRLDACIYSQIILASPMTGNDIKRITNRVENIDEVECRNRGVLQKRPLYDRCCLLHTSANCNQREKRNWIFLNGDLH